MSSIYMVTAGNRYFWQSLVVTAATVEEAADKFEAFLNSPESKAFEAEECRDAAQEFGPQDPDDHRYRFDPSDVEERDYVPRWHGAPSEEVQVTDAGGNG